MNAKQKFKLFHNGRIQSLDAHSKPANALLVFGNKIAFCGAEHEINLPDYVTDKFDLLGNYVFPSFTDCHTHVAAVALTTERVRLDHCQNKQEALDEIHNFIIRTQPGEWILGSGWNANIWPEDLPDKSDLDQLSELHPIALYNKDGHTQWLNSLALQKCGFDDTISDPSGGKFGRGRDNSLNGLIYEKACSLVDAIADKTSYEQLSRCMHKLYPKLHQLGISGVHSCEGMDIYKIFQTMAINDTLKIRVCMHPPATGMDRLINAGLHSGTGDIWLRLGGLKYFMDGSLGSQTADLFEPYEATTQQGIAVLSEEELYNYSSRAAENGLSATVHAIGDRAIFKTLNVLTRLSEINSPVPLRHRIEHSQIMRPTDIDRMGKLNVIASMQPLHIADDIQLAEKHLGKRSRYTYPVRSILDAGCRVVFGSDMPIADPDPLLGMLAAVSRRYKLNPEESSWYPEQAITSGEALLAYTREAAFASYEENLKGTLTPGKLADFIVVDNDLAHAEERQLRQLKVLMTVIDGTIRYQDQSGSFR